ncbi:hypothetical protein [Nonomuraea sp. NPDC050783]
MSLYAEESNFWLAPTRGLHFQVTIQNSRGSGGTKGQSVFPWVP